MTSEVKFLFQKLLSEYFSYTNSLLDSFSNSSSNKELPPNDPNFELFSDSISKLDQVFFATIFDSVTNWYSKIENEILIEYMSIQSNSKKKSFAYQRTIKRWIDQRIISPKSHNLEANHSLIELQSEKIIFLKYLFLSVLLKMIRNQNKIEEGIIKKIQEMISKTTKYLDQEKKGNYCQTLIQQKNITRTFGLCKDIISNLSKKYPEQFFVQLLNGLKLETKKMIPILQYCKFNPEKPAVINFAENIFNEILNLMKNKKGFINSNKYLVEGCIGLINSLIEKNEFTNNFQERLIPKINEISTKLTKLIKKHSSSALLNKFYICVVLCKEILQYEYKKKINF
ncbi:protein furry [Anaeramoeba flamelloides]|nr:protein furry [Anaeramoeba flamelloides]